MILTTCPACAAPLAHTAPRCVDASATLDDLREAVRTLEETERTVRRVFGGAHPLATTIGLDLRDARAALRARETPPQNAVADS